MRGSSFKICCIVFRSFLLSLNLCRIFKASFEPALASFCTFTNVHRCLHCFEQYSQSHKSNEDIYRSSRELDRSWFAWSGFYKRLIFCLLSNGAEELSFPNKPLFSLLNRISSYKRLAFWMSLSQVVISQNLVYYSLLLRTLTSYHTNWAETIQ